MDVNKLILDTDKIQLNKKYVFASMMATSITDTLPEAAMKRWNKHLKSESDKKGLKIHLHAGSYLCLISSRAFGYNSTPDCFARMLSEQKNRQKNVLNIEKTLNDFSEVCISAKQYAKQLLAE